MLMIICLMMATNNLCQMCVVSTNDGVQLLFCVISVTRFFMKSFLYHDLLTNDLTASLAPTHLTSFSLIDNSN